MAFTYGYALESTRLAEIIERLGDELKRIIANAIAPVVPVVRQLRPQDLGLTRLDWKVTIPAGQTEVEVVSIEIPSDSAIGILGFGVDKDSVIEEVVIRAGARDVAIVSLTDLKHVTQYASDYATGIKFLTGADILKIPPRTRISIRVRLAEPLTSAKTEKFIVYGLIAEPNGKVVHYS